MKNIRHSVFETNSSSTHSISISDQVDGIYDTLIPDNGVIVLNGGEFGWEWEAYNDAESKANYAAVYAHRGSEELQTMLVDVIKEHTGAKEVIFNFKTKYEDDTSPHLYKYLPYAYIDHQSSDVGQDAFKSKETLKNFIFNSKSTLYTGNDNDDSPPNFFDDPDTKYTYVLEIEGCKPLKFAKKPTRKQISDGIEKIIYFYIDKINKNINYSQGSWGYYNNYDKDLNGKKLNSLEKFKNNEQKIILFNLMSQYSKDNERKFLGYKVKSTKVIEFSIKKI